MRFSFTGSTASGKAVIRDAAAGIKPLTLELGGNDPAIVLPDVDIKTVAQYVQWINVPHFVPYLPTENCRHVFIGAINNAGQQCFAMKRLFIHEDIYDAFRDEIVALAKHTKVGNPFDSDTIMGPVQNQRVYEKLKCALWYCQ